MKPSLIASARKTRLGKAVISVFAIALAVVSGRLVIGPLPKAKLYPPPSPVILDHTGKPLRFFLAPDDQWRFRIKLEELNPELVRSELAFEDRWFFYHPGVNPFALARAFFQNLRSDEIVSGGSTLTMQVARMLERRPRTYSSKLIEIFRALQLESRYSKKQILAFYFNLAPYGGNIQGVAAASYLYFGKPPDRLGPAETALLVALPAIARDPEAGPPSRKSQSQPRPRARAAPR
jgi:penicillin-binding protein 1C